MIVFTVGTDVFTADSYVNVSQQRPGYRAAFVMEQNIRMNGEPLCETPPPSIATRYSVAPNTPQPANRVDFFHSPAQGTLEIRVS